MTELPKRLPRLLYLGDVPVEASYHGSGLLYRLLEDYPKDRLSIVEAGMQASKPERRIDGVEYNIELMPLRRLGRSRCHTWYSAIGLRLAEPRVSGFLSLASKFDSEAVLSVTHGFSWITADALARRLALPLHLICHDEWARAGDMQGWKDRVFRDIYRRAASRLCVSPFMAEEYERRYGALGEVLYPSRAANASRHGGIPARISMNAEPLTCAFAGTINSNGATENLRTLAGALAPSGGRLLIYGPLSAEAALASGLGQTNIELCGFVSSGELVERLRAEADVLYVPMSFAEVERSHMQMGFPSKLTDYTAVGLPLLIHGPDYCSAVRWARENSGVAEVVTTTDEAAIATAFDRLRDREHRVRLARASRAVGERYFSHRAAVQAFHSALNLSEADRASVAVKT